MWLLYAILTTAHAQTPCVTPQLLERTFQKSLVVIDKAEPLRACDETNLPYRVRKAAYDLKTQPGIFHAGTRLRLQALNVDPWGFVARHAKQLVVGEQTDACEFLVPGHVAPIEYGRIQKIFGASADDKALVVCRDAGKLSDLTLRGLLVHMSAHAEKDALEHQSCYYGPYSVLSTPLCDTTYAGAYGAEAEYYVATARNPELRPEVRAEARAVAIERLTYHVNEEPLNLETGVMLFPERGGMIFFNGKALIPVVDGLPRGFVPLNREYRVSLVNPVTGDLLEYDFKRGFVAGPKVPGPGGIPLDWIEVGDMRCFLFARAITCQKVSLTNAEVVTREVSGVELRGFRWQRTFFSSADLEEGSPRFARVLARDGTQFKLPLRFEDFKATSALEKQPAGPETVPGEVTRVFMTRGRSELAAISLQADGSVWATRHEDKDSKPARPIEALKGQRFKHLSGPILWSRYLEAI